MNDIVNGLNYLHEIAHMSHGQFNLHSCVITPQWSVRLSNYGLTDVLNDGVNMKLLTIPEKSAHGWLTKRNTVILVERLHIAPELMNGVIVASFPGDIYALGIVAYEVLHKMFIQDVVNQDVNIF